MKEIPIIIHHEGNQEYVHYCIWQASKYNKRVILFGDESNKSFCDEWYDVKEFELKEWNDFLKVFCNYSDYKDAYAQQIFKRFFLLYEFMEKKQCDECMLLDSDVLIFTDFSKYNWDKYIASLSVPREQANYRWTANTGCSYWTKNAVKSFIDYCLKIYCDSSSLILEKYEYHKRNNLPGGICEMTLLYLWYLENVNEVLNTTIKRNDGVIDLNLNISENYTKNEYQYNNWLRIKKVHYIDHEPYVVSASGEYVKAYALHFGAFTKAYMVDFYYGRKVKFYKKIFIYIKSYYGALKVIVNKARRN